MDKMLYGFFVTLFGIATTLLTAAGLVYLELHYDCAIYGYVYAFIVPMGAILSGFVAASGYYFGSKLLSHRPGRGVLACVIAISGGNFFLIYWLEYILLKVDGEPIHSYISYLDYLRFTLTHTSVTMNFGAVSNGDAINLGMGGYAYAALLIAGFAFGGFIIYNILRMAPFCESCGVYMKKQGSQTRYFVRYEDLAECFAAFKAEMEAGQFRRAMEVHADAGSRKLDASSGYSLRAEIKQCKGCGKQWVELVAMQRVNKKWNRITNIKFSAYCTQRVDAIEELASSS
jgi:hypothetical protein